MTANLARRLALLALLLALCAALGGCERAGGADAVRVLIDGEAWPGGAYAAERGDDLRVYIALDGAPLVDLPFAEAHTVSVLQPDGASNVVRLTGEAVYMQGANCENQDCVGMGEVTRENLELRVLGGFIICLPHRLSVEVRGE